MTLAGQYDSIRREHELEAHWDTSGIYQFEPDTLGAVYAIDTPPASVSGRLHLGHVYSYAHADFFARYRRMRGDTVFYPMGYDDNGLPTERLVERTRGVRATEIGRAAFIRECLAVSAETEREYEALWRRLGLSVDWRYSYRTIDDHSRRTAQAAFLDLLQKDLVYRRKSPGIWCPECRTAIAQAELNDLERESTFYTLAFSLDNGETLPIATTRPELLPACVAVFINPEDRRYRDLIGRQVTAPLFNHQVPILADASADPETGTGAVMCCTYGDVTDISWQRTHKLPTIEAIGRDGKMTPIAGAYAGLTIEAARQQVIIDLANRGLVLADEPHVQTVRVHERCDTPVEYLNTRQWFIRILDHRAAFLDAGEKIEWHPAHMGIRYRQWVENLNWDWCISRQRAFGVAFPIWYCKACGKIAVPDVDELPVDPLDQQPSHPCPCGSDSFLPETDVMDTWATSSLTPQIVGRWLSDEDLYRRVYPMALRPQAHEIIRTWAFYTIVRSHFLEGRLPWSHVAISGWGLAPEGAQKLSKSRGGGPVGAMEALDRYSADAVRYWAAGTGLGKDTVISLERIQAGAKWATKIWNVARFSERFLIDFTRPDFPPEDLTTADRWLLARLNQVVTATTAAFDHYDYATARSEIETFFWRDLADNYLEMAKQRLYEGECGYNAARFTLYQALMTTVQLLAPLMPYITDAVYLDLFAWNTNTVSIHQTGWPKPDPRFDDPVSLDAGGLLIEIAGAVRRYKSENNLSLGAELKGVHLAEIPPEHKEALQGAVADLQSITRGRTLTIDNRNQARGEVIWEGSIVVMIEA